MYLAIQKLVILNHFFRSLDKFMKLEKETSTDFDDELFDLLPINCNFLKYFTMLNDYRTKLRNYCKF